MIAHKFDQPLSIFVGLGFPRDVETVLDAYDILLEWNGIPDLDYHGALEVCRKAINDERTAADVREAFENFARNKGILSEEALDRAASSLAREWGRLSA
ncbi:DUF982 domain-containing protein [Mesorhizobium sp. CGMCC 1.15528]|uniref:DUF982 domain-containing protein n=1 Tax=Mesorhizobium zhangyense TaxID=1776730 RepID=A0A7C9RC72_9HYPH|nr:DUF982 domain-containing protein [Mesorhizobium zhangyense]NGN43133.1 DUF982 domain-containing protein [Mesorhizobium zhangyense]